MDEQNQNTSIQVKLSIEEANVAIEALSKMSFSKVYKIIEKIHVAAKNQTDSVANSKN